MAKYRVTEKQVQPKQKPRRSVASMVIRAMPGVIGLGLIGFGLLVIVAVHAGGHNENSRAGVGFIVIGMIVLGLWAFGSKSDGYNF